ncbi:MAG TPA: PEP/pyruvate-binding domain-containing protein [Candidatus Sulfomarinibacteraceae bacterium]|nr:PEP/pyruvate-binding domain-containing protein [Candidatus Sulfomarinibacteraceae bacterium]
MERRSLRSTTSTIDIYIKLAQYPILADQIRERMRQEIFKRGIIDEHTFEEEVEQLALESQRREGVHDPFASEPPNIWHRRKARIRAFHTDFYFGYNLPTDLFEEIIQQVLSQQPEHTESPELAFNPEIAPWSLLFKQGEIYENLPAEERERVSHHLEEIKVVLIKSMISDQLPYIGVAKRVFTMADLRHIYEHRIGDGKIGGKAAGMLLAWKILQRCDPDVSEKVTIPESYYLGTDMLYEFHRLNNLERFMNQKYRPLDEIRSEYPKIVEAHLQGRFPKGIVSQLRDLLRETGTRPLIVRSSSLLEDNFGHAFAGKYQSHFCPNQGSEEENLQALLDAIRRIYASALNPDALLYRKRHNLIDYDERMAVLIQPVTGHRYGRYFFPTVAGVGFSRNPFRWNPKIRREDGFLRLVWGMGTRAVDRVSDDYPRMIALSHPHLRPETTAQAIRQYAQYYADVIDLQSNRLRTVSVREIMDLDYPYLRYIASELKEDYVQEVLSTAGLESTDDLVITFDRLVKDRNFTRLMRSVLDALQEAYETPVDIEFTVEIDPDYPYCDYTLNVLQCRPLSERISGEAISIPADLPQNEVLFRSYDLIPDGKVKGVRYIIFVHPLQYRSLNDNSARLEIGRAIGRLNKILEDETFVIMGPGRWGSANLDLGVRIGYADIFNTKALIEMAVAGASGVPELSYGTHFFQDLVEGGIYSLPLHLEQPRSYFNWDFFESAPNALARLCPPNAALADTLKVIDIAAIAPEKRLTILMDGSQDETVGFLQKGKWRGPKKKASLSTF